MAQSIFYVNNKDKKNEAKKSLKSPALRQVSAEPSQSRESNSTRKSLNRSRKLLQYSVGLVVLVFGALIFLLYNQSRVLQVSAQNAEIRSQINDLQKENARRREEISKSLDLDKIKEEAQKLGLQMPQARQIIRVKQEKNDQIIVNIHSANARGVDGKEEELEEILANVEGFFKTIH